MKHYGDQMLEAKIEKLFKKLVNSKSIHECTMHIENANGDFNWNMGYGGRTIDSPMFLASVTKLFTTTCILNLKIQGKLAFEDNLSKYFSSEIIKGVHIYKGVDYSNDLTVGNLLFQNTGFPDVFSVGKYPLHKKMVYEDFTATLEDYVKIAKDNKKLFAPGSVGKAHYSDLNFEMMGKIIEKLENSSLHEAFKKYVFDPLELKNTYLPENEKDFIPNVYYKNIKMKCYKTIRSIPASGGGISTSNDTMKFLKAFFGGKLFEKGIFNELRKFATIQYGYPLAQYGGGFMRLNISGIGTMFKCKGEMIGHIGMTGTYAYYYPEKDLYFVGDYNQFATPSRTFTIPLNLAKIVSNY